MSLTPAYAMNPANMGKELRKCKCGEKFNGYKTSLRTKCTPCYTKVGEEFCRRCAGTGQFITGVTNDVPTGPGGDCFRCGGKGYQTPADQKRNDNYNRFAGGRYV
jgi:hypothetical protein